MESTETALPASGVEDRQSPITPTARPGLFEQAREGTFHQLNTQKDRAATGLTSFAYALRQSGRQLEGENATVASYVDVAAGQVDRLVDGLRDRDIAEMMSDLERFARRRPGVFLGSAFVLGLVAARFLKSSTKPEQPWSRSSSMPPMPTTPREPEPLA